MKRLTVALFVALTGCVAHEHAQLNTPITADSSPVICEAEVPVGSMIERVVCRAKPMADPRDTDTIMQNIEHRSSQRGFY